MVLFEGEALASAHGSAQRVGVGDLGDREVLAVGSYDRARSTDKCCCRHVFIVGSGRLNVPS
jgi:hypothetical protein